MWLVFCLRWGEASLAPSPGLVTLHKSSQHHKVFLSTVSRYSLTVSSLADTANIIMFIRKNSAASRSEKQGSDECRRKQRKLIKVCVIIYGPSVFLKSTFCHSDTCQNGSLQRASRTLMSTCVEGDSLSKRRSRHLCRHLLLPRKMAMEHKLKIISLTKWQ